MSSGYFGALCLFFVCWLTYKSKKKERKKEEEIRKISTEILFQKNKKATVNS
jgi:uncharacterized membrane protein